MSRFTLILRYRHSDKFSMTVCVWGGGGGEGEEYICSQPLFARLTCSFSAALSVSKQLVKQFERALTTSAIGRFDALVKQIPKVGRSA